MGKKQKDKIPVYREKFSAGAEREGDRPAASQPRFSLSSNRSPAMASISLTPPRTAGSLTKRHILKANYPLQYFRALMTSVSDKTDKLVEYIDEATQGRNHGSAA